MNQLIHFQKDIVAVEQCSVSKINHFRSVMATVTLTYQFVFHQQCLGLYIVYLKLITKIFQHMDCINVAIKGMLTFPAHFFGSLSRCHPRCNPYKKLLINIPRVMIGRRNVSVRIR